MPTHLVLVDALVQRAPQPLREPLVVQCTQLQLQILALSLLQALELPVRNALPQWDNW